MCNKLQMYRLGTVHMLKYVVMIHKSIVILPKIRYLARVNWGEGWGGSSCYYTIIDFNEVDIRIYLPKKGIIHRGR